MAATTAVNSRAGWPITVSMTPYPEEIEYRERFMDWQGPGLRGRDRTWRRFDTIRRGRAFR
jgi:hypothetical protein